MATTYASRAPVGAAQFGPLELMRTLRDRWHRRSLYRRTLKALSGLGDRELEDIGLSRRDIVAAARRATYGIR